MSKRRYVVSYFDLPEQWQTEARNNLGAEAEETLYLEPLETDIPEKHILWDLSEATTAGQQKAILPISNNSALKLYFNEDYSEAVMRFI
jgi:hypothetical protein